MTNPMKILVASSLCPNAIEQLKLHHDVRLAINAPVTELCNAISDREILVFRSGVQINRQVLSAAPSLKLLIRGLRVGQPRSGILPTARNRAAEDPRTRCSSGCGTCFRDDDSSRPPNSFQRQPVATWALDQATDNGIRIAEQGAGNHWCRQHRVTCWTNGSRLGDACDWLR